MSSRNLLFRIFLASLLLLLPALGACGSTRSGTAGTSAAAMEEEENDEDESPPVTRRIEWTAAEIALESSEGTRDTVTFNIGSPVFLRLQMRPGSSCTPFNGQPFYFDASGSQLGWGFTEVADSLLFPREARPCDRMVMLSSEKSNQLAEGYYTLKVQIFNDERSRINSDTIVLHPVRSSGGATEQSYSRFIQEQIIRNSQLLVNDADTRAALFGEGVPRSAESEIYHAVILYRSGDIAEAERALQSAAELEKSRRRTLGIDARIARDGLVARLTGAAPAR